jgi:hypothetical protein
MNWLQSFNTTKYITEQEFITYKTSIEVKIKSLEARITELEKNIKEHSNEIIVKEPSGGEETNLIPLRIFIFGDKIFAKDYNSTILIKDSILKTMGFKYSPEYWFGPNISKGGWMGSKNQLNEFKERIQEFNATSKIKIRIICLDMIDENK